MTAPHRRSENRNERQLTRLSAGALLALIMLASPVRAAPPIPVDDSYTVSRRLAAYQAQYPMLRLPEPTFHHGERLLTDRLYRRIGERELHLDVVLPAPRKANRRAVMLVHGGGWRSGTKAEFLPLAVLLAHRGYAVFLPEYRLSPEAKYPAGLEDVSAALAWIRSQSAAFGFDPAQLSVGGGSSGGQLAALLAYSSPEPPSALIDLDGVLDFTDPLALQYENSGATSSAALWLGGTMETAPDLWRAASPANHVGATAPPTLLISSGQPRYTAGRETVLAALSRYGVRNRLVIMDKVPHTFWLFEPWVSQTASEIDRFLRD